MFDHKTSKTNPKTVDVKIKTKSGLTVIGTGQNIEAAQKDAEKKAAFWR